MGTRIVQVEQGSELAAEVFRFRYRIYVEEMSRPQRYADPVAKTIEEPLDRCSALFAAIDDSGSVVGTVRYTPAERCPNSDYTSIYRMDAFPAYFPGHCSFTTKLMVSAPYRHTTLAMRLAMAAWDVGATSGHSANFIDCNEHLVEFFKGFGYMPFPTRFQHPEYGCVQVMVLPVRDLKYFERIRSPFLRRARALAIPHEDLEDAISCRVATL